MIEKIQLNQPQVQIHSGLKGEQVGPGQYTVRDFT